MPTPPNLHTTILLLFILPIYTLHIRKTLPCTNDCSSTLNNYTSSPPVIRGTCINGQCVCGNGFGGQDCSKISGTPPKITYSPPPEIAQDKCTQDVCTSTCSFGGSCIDPLTCRCFDHWGNGQAGDPSTITIPKTDTPLSTTSTSTSMLVDRWPMNIQDRNNLQSILTTLGYKQSIPTGDKDPCTHPWISIAASPLQNPHVLVLCNNRGKVTEIDLSRMELKGTISKAITAMDELRVLSVNNNAITGSIPIEIGKLTKLEYLILHKNHISGAIPSSLSNCRSLITFVGYGNLLSGSIPYGIGNLQASLRMLDLSYNRLSGDIPASIGDLMNLETLYVNNNNLIGIVPDTINALPNLKAFMYQENKIKNTVENIGNNDVYDSPEHTELAEKHYEKWKNGIEFAPRNEKRFNEENAKRQTFQEAEKAAKEGAAFKLDAKAAKMLPKAFQPSGDGDEGGGAVQLGTQVGGASVIDGT